MAGGRIDPEGTEVLRHGRGYEFREQLMNRIVRLIFPPIANSVAGEVNEQAPDKLDAGGAPNYLRVVDCGSETTIVSFSNAVLLHAGQPTSIFEGFFSKRGKQHNLVFLRDVQRTVFHYTPSAEPNGLAFHEALLNKTLADLGSKRVIGIGDSGGASAAIYFGVRCGFEQVIAFSPSHPLRHWIGPRAQLRLLFDFPLLARQPGIYWEHILIASLALGIVYLPVSLHCGFGSIFDPIADYCAAQKRPALTVFYGERCWPETNIVAPLRGLPDVSLRPQPTASHFSMIPLARAGSLGTTILEIIEGSGSAGGPANTEPVSALDRSAATALGRLRRVR